MNFKRIATVLTISVALVMSALGSAFACTSIYVGKDVSDTGDVYVGRSEDYANNYNKMLGVAPATEHQAGDMYVDCNGFEWPYPAKTYAYTYIKESPVINPEETMFDDDGNPLGEPYAAGCVNEKGVYITATVTTSCSNAARAADPLVDDGIYEVSIPSVLMANSATAKEAVDLLAKIIEEKGSGECYFILIGDGKETWSFDCVAGHQYVATRLPSDKVGFNPNIMLIGEVDVTDTENVVASRELVSLPEENGFLKKGPNGKIHVAATYSKSFKNTRFMQGLYFMDPAQAETFDYSAINADNPFPTMMVPNRKLSTFEAIRFLAYRGEGTPYDGNNPGITSIGNNRHTECHVFQTRQGFPMEMATIEWVTPADAEFGIFLPYYGAMVTDVHKAYKVDSDEYVPNSVNWNANKINDTCDKNRDNYDKIGAVVKAYVEKYQKSLIDQQEQVDQDMRKVYNLDPKMASEAATEMGKDLAEQYMTVTDSIVEELTAYVEAGDFENALELSVAKNDVMPVYQVPAKYMRAVAIDQENKDKIADLEKKLAEAQKKVAELEKASADKAALEKAKEEARKAEAKLIAASKKLTVKKVVVKVRKKVATVSWKKTKGADGYQVQFAKKGGKFKTLKADTKSLKAKTKKLKKAKYSFRVRTYKKVAGEKVYGKWSLVKTVKIK